MMNQSTQWDAFMNWETSSSSTTDLSAWDDGSPTKPSSSETNASPKPHAHGMVSRSAWNTIQASKSIDKGSQEFPTLTSSTPIPIPGSNKKEEDAWTTVQRKPHSSKTTKASKVSKASKASKVSNASNGSTGTRPMRNPRESRDSRPTPVSSQSNSSASRYVCSRMCKRIIQYNRCTLNTCQYAHTCEELQPSKCVRGYDCPNGRTDCPYLHPREHKDQLIRRLQLETYYQTPPSVSSSSSTTKSIHLSNSPKRSDPSSSSNENPEEWKETTMLQCSRSYFTQYASHIMDYLDEYLNDHSSITLQIYCD
jgi:hypothetical protein